MELTHPLAVVTPTLDGDVLRILALAEADFTAAQLHGMISESSKRGVDKVLVRLVEQGIVIRTHTGRPSLYRLNRMHLGAEAVIALARQKETLIERLQQALADWPLPPEFAALFGSGARGNHAVQSDIDLLFIRPDDSDDDRWDEQVERICSRVTSWTGNDTRSVSYLRRDVVERGRQEPLLIEVLKDGIPLTGDFTWMRRVLKPSSTT